MNAPPVSLETARLHLRRVEAGDAELIFATWAQDPEVTRYLTWKPHTSLSQTEAHVERCVRCWDSGNEYTWIIEDTQTREAIGTIAARPNGHAVAFGYLLVPSRWRQGYMTEVVQALADRFLMQPEIYRVRAVCDVDNAGSAGVLLRAGFQLEGTLRNFIVHPNMSYTPRDVLCYSRIPE